MSGTLPLSVIVCTHNRACYLPDCLESLAQQTCDVPFEVVVVDNASTDHTPQILAAWSLKDARFRPVLEPRLGLSVAKNAGVRAARGQLLLFTDDDVIVDRNWIRVYDDFFRRTPDEFVIAGGPIVPVPHDLEPWPDWFDLCALPDVGLLDYGEERRLRRDEYVWGANMAIPAERFRHVGFWNEAVGRQGEMRGTFEDTEYQDRVRAMGGATWFCSSASLQHRIPRDVIAASRILRTAFARARNDFWREVSLQREHGLFSPRDDYARNLAILGRHLTGFAFSSVGFTIRPTASAFRQAHAAAKSSGSAVDVLRAGRESTRLSATIGHASFFILDSVLAMVRAGGERGWAPVRDAQPLR
jgi:glycosyltransferase involved in cell wall biosynthesis